MKTEKTANGVEATIALNKNIVTNFYYHRSYIKDRPEDEIWLSPPATVLHICTV